MRKVEVFLGDRHAGQLKELSNHDYEFTYDDAYLSDAQMPSISVTLPKHVGTFRSSQIFSFFTNLLPEGAIRKAMCTTRKVDERDFFGMLEMICGMDCIGNVTLRK